MEKARTARYRRLVESRTRNLFTALGLCVVVAGLLVSMPAIARVISAPAAFVLVMIFVVPLLVLTQKAWRRVLWNRRLASARARVSAAPGDPEAHVELGVLCSLAGNDDEARSSFEQARSLLPGHAQASIGLAHLAAENGDLDAALALFTEAAEREPELFAAHYGIGGVQQRREQYARAILAYEKALAIEPDDAFTLAELSRCHLGLGDPDKAAEYFARAAGQGLRDPDLEKMIRAATAPES